jgi:FkbM family methyltransferase
LTSERFRRVTALEADATTFERLTTYVHTLPAPIQAKVSPVNMAVGAAAGFASFNADGSVRSSVGSGTAEVEVTTLDAISARAPITFVKMDIEGAEPLAVAGGRRAIRDDRPILAVCLYHAFDHLWTIPNALAAIAGDYDFFLGRHSDECWELVCYAVPRGRRVGA